MVVNLIISGGGFFFLFIFQTVIKLFCNILELYSGWWSLISLEELRAHRALLDTCPQDGVVRIHPDCGLSDCLTQTWKGTQNINLQVTCLGSTTFGPQIPPSKGGDSWQAAMALY